MFKKFLFFIGLIIFSNFVSLSSAEILPLKKPSQTKEEKEQKLLVDVLKPLPKPIINKAKKEDKKETNKKISFKVKNQDLGIILPKKKTLNSKF